MACSLQVVTLHWRTLTAPMAISNLRFLPACGLLFSCGGKKGCVRSLLLLSQIWNCPKHAMLRTGRRTASLGRVQVLGYPLRQNWKAQDKRALQRVGSRSRDGAGYKPSPFCLHFFANSLFSGRLFDKLLLMAAWPSVSISLHPGMHTPLENSSSEPTTSHGRLRASGPVSGAPVSALSVHFLDIILSRASHHK